MWITRDEYDQLLKQYKQKQGTLLGKMQQYSKASEEYYVTANTILNLAQQAYDIFQRSETEEKRQLLNFVFQNMQLDQRELVFSVRKPFDTLVESNPRPTLGERRDSCSPAVRRKSAHSSFAAWVPQNMPTAYFSDTLLIPSHKIKSCT